MPCPQGIYTNVRIVGEPKIAPLPAKVHRVSRLSNASGSTLHTLLDRQLAVAFLERLLTF
jgi:hypothetical protein